jgi:RNA polymerase sigma-70 factor (ECF subfamily)
MDAREPDEPSLDEWYADARRRLVGVLSVSSGSRSSAEELADETLVRALEKWDDRVVVEATSAWLFTVARNLLRRTRRREALFARFARSHRPIEAADVPDFSPEVVAAIAALAPRQREAVALRYVLGLRCREIAEAMGVSEGTAMRTLFDARQRLAASLGEPLTADAEAEAEADGLVDGAQGVEEEMS